jgi:hypothetical protein
MRATGAAGIYDEQPFGKALADIDAARQHIANQSKCSGATSAPRSSAASLPTT